jgi:branched-chain amino acid transport system substrate-binding protein
MANRWIIFFSLFFLSVSLQADEALRAEIDRIIYDYEMANYHSAGQHSLALYQQDSIRESQYASLILFLHIKSIARMEQFETVIEKSRLFKSSYPQSRYLDDISLELADQYFKRRLYSNAYLSAMEALNHSDEAETESSARELSRQIALHYLTIEEHLNSGYLLPGGKALILHKLLIAEKQLAAGRKKLAEKTLVHIRESIITRSDMEHFNRLLQILHNREKKQVKVALLLPLTGDFGQQGQALLDGIRYGLDRHRYSLKYDLELIVLDTESDPVTAVKQAQNAVNIKNLIAVIGPVSSASAIAVAPVCTEHKIPMITPTATATGLAGISEFIFQINTGISQRGYNIGAFAVDSLKLKTFATIAPADDYGQEITLSFIEAVEKRGGEVLEMIWYSGEPRSLRHEFRELRDLAFQLLAADSADTNNILYYDSTLVLNTAADSLKIKLDRIEGIYIPLYADDIQFIAPQLAYWNFKTQLLGDANWYQPLTLEKYRRYIDRIIFVTSAWSPEDDPHFIRFKEDYESALGEDANNLNINGYETIKLLMHLIQLDNTNPEELQRGLAELKLFKGFIRDINFSEKQPRVNSSLHYFQFRNNRIYKLK